MAERFFFIRRDGRIEGPYTAARLRVMSREKQLSFKDEVSPDKEQWTLALNLDWLDFSGRKVRELQADTSPDELPANMEIPDAEISGGIPPLIRNEPVVLQTGGEEDSPVRIIGDSLSLLWNTPDNLPRLMKQQTLPATALTIFAFTLLLTLSGGMVFAFRRSESFQVFCLILLLYFLFGAGTFAENMLIRIVFAPRGSGSVSGDLLLSLTHFINTIPALILTLLYGPKAWGEPNSAIGIFIFAVLAMVWLFSISNLSAGIRILLVKMNGMRPRHAVWTGAFLLWSNTLFVCLFFFILTKINKG